MLLYTYIAVTVLSDDCMHVVIIYFPHSPCAQCAGELEAVRRAQHRRWMWSHVSWQLMARFRGWPGMAELVAGMEERVEAGHMAPGTAADHLLDHFFNTTRHK